MRKELFNAIIESQQKLIDSLEASLETMATSTDLDEEMTQDLDSYSQQSNIQLMEINIRKKLEMEKTDMKNIKILKNIESDEVIQGSIVATDKDYYFFGYAFSPIKYQGKNIFGVSPEAPAFEKNAGKKEGDILELGQIKLEIKAIY